MNKVGKYDTENDVAKVDGVETKVRVDEIGANKEYLLLISWQIQSKYYFAVLVFVCIGISKNLLISQISVSQTEGHDPVPASGNRSTGYLFLYKNLFIFK